MCNMVTEKEIVAVLKKGAKSTSDIQKITSAGTNCGKCLVVIDGVVEEFLSDQTDDSQKSFDFES